MVLSNDIAALIGFACEAVCWGVYVVLFVTSLVLLYRRKRVRKQNTAHGPILYLMIALFACCTTHFAIEFNHFYTILGATGVDGFANETNLLFGGDILLSVCDLLGDFILIYRCWIVWNRNYWVIILPTLAAVAGFGCVCEVAHLVLTIDPTAPLPPPALVPLGTASYVLPLGTNVMATGLIVYKLWSMIRNNAVLSGDSAPVFSRGYDAVRSAVGIVVESGALYLVTQLIFVVLYSIQHPAIAIQTVIAVQIYGIAPTLIVMRIALGVSSDQTLQQTPTDLSGAGGRAFGSSLSNVVARPNLRSTEETLKPSDGDSIEMKAYLGTSHVSLTRESA